MFRIDGLREHRCRPGTSGVRQLESGTAVGPVVTQHDRYVIDLHARKMISESSRHPFRGDLFPSLRNGQLGNGHALLQAAATIDRQRDAGDVAGLVRCQEEDGVGDVLGLDPADR